MSKVFSLDCETDGLYGDAFAVGAVVINDGVVVAEFAARVDDVDVVNHWVAENVLPALASMPVTHRTAREMRSAFWGFWKAHKNGATVIAHMGIPVESQFFRQCVEDDTDARMWDGPFPLHEVSTALMLAGENPTSVDEYNKKYGVAVPFSGVSHHPLYDAHAAAAAWNHLVTK